MFTAKTAQEFQFYTNILQQILNHPESLSAFQVETTTSDEVGKNMITLADNISTEWVKRMDAFERNVSAPKVAVAGPMDTARIANGNGNGLRLTDH